jgi:zinc D-Ala-D-Ala carboxypeptidase
MGDLTEHFSSAEFACRCGCGAARVEDRLVEALQALRDVVGRPVRVTSGVRCEAHNRAVGGAEGSQHLSGRAADIVVGGVAPVAIGWIGRTLRRFSGIRIYESWTHLDVREGERWWRGF